MSFAGLARVAKQTLNKLIFGTTAIVVGLSGLAVAAPLFLSAPAYAAGGNLVLNEVFPSPDLASQNEWVEIYNPNNVSINLAGWSITSSSHNFSGDSSVTSDCSGAVPAHGYCVFTNTDQTSAQQLLLNGGDTVTLSNGSFMDTVTYSSTDVSSSASYARATNGVGTWASSAPTMGTSNDPSAELSVCALSCDYSSIANAVSAISSGGTVYVNAGDYTGLGGISITKNLTLLGAQSGVDARTRNALTTEESTIVGFNITGANVTIDGFRIVPGSDNSGVGIRFQDGTAETVQNNIITGYESEGIGVFNTGDVTIQHNLFTSSPSSSSATDGVFAGGGTSDNLQVLNNKFVDASIDGTDIGLSFDSGSSPLISGNVSTGGATLVTLFNASGGQVTNNTFTGDQSYTGSIVYIGGGSSNTIVSGNVVSGSSGGAIAVANDWGVGVNSGITITGNTITGSVRGLSIGSGSIDSSETIEAHQNIITGNTLGARNLSGGSLDAANNYWGSANPTTLASLFSGSNITYTPYYVDSGLTTLNTTAPASVYVDSSYNDISAGGHVFGYDAFTTIQEAVNTVASSGTVNIAAGTYNESLTVSQSLTLTGAGSEADSSTNTIISSSASNGLTVTGNNVTLSNFRIDKQGTGRGIEASAPALTNLTISNVTATNGTVGLRVSNTSSIDGLHVSDSHFDGNTFGWYLAKDTASSATVTNVDVTNTHFDNNTQKGIYAEKLDNAMFDGIYVLASGTDTSYGFNAGIDINLKWSAYSNITIQNSSIINSGWTGTASDIKFPAGLTIKARDDGGYASPAASLDGVTISNLTVSNGVNGIRFGEPGKNNAGPTNISLNSVKFSGNTNKDLINETQSQITANGNWWNNALGPSSGRYSGDVVVSNWCTTSACTATQSASSGTTTLPSEPIATPTVSGDTASVTLPDTNDVVATTTTSSGTVQVTIPAGATITADSSAWDGTINPPSVTTVNLPDTSGFTTTPSLAIEVGSSSFSLTFDQAVRLVLPGQAGKLVGFIPAGGSSADFTPITTVCGADDQATVDAQLSALGVNECKIVSGSDLVVWTKHFTKFVAYTQTSSPGGSSSGSTSGTSSTTPAAVFASAASAGVATNVLGTQNTTPAAGGKTSSTSTKAPKAAAAANTAAAKKAGGIKWYWWVIIVALLMAIGSAYYLYRIADTVDKKS